MPPVIDASHTTFIARANRDRMLLKLIEWRYCSCFRWTPYIPGITAQTPGVEPGRTARYYSNSNNTHCENSGTVNRKDASHPPEPCSGAVSRLRNLYFRSTQNTDTVSSVNFLVPSVSYPFILLFNSFKTINIYVT